MDKYGALMNVVCHIERDGVGRGESFFWEQSEIGGQI